jgi:DNA polymerase I
MIVDDFYVNGEIPILYTRYRDSNGELIEDTIKGYKPYFWIPANVGDYRKRRLLARYPGTQITDERAIGLDGTPLIKVVVESPFDIFSMKQEFDKTYEADVRFTDRWLIDNVHEMPVWNPRKWWFDIECDTGDDPFTTVIAVIDSDLDTPVVFAWADERTNCSYDSDGAYMRKVRDVDYELRLYRNESQLHEAFVSFLQERDPDMMIAHAGSFFDIPHLLQRIPNPQRLSPVGQIRRMKRGKDRYDPTDQPIVGRWQFDTAAQASSGTGFERVWKDSGGGQLPSLKLNDIAETVGLGSKLTEEIEGMDVHNGWYEYWDDFVDYCFLDTHLLRGIDEARNVTDFYIEMVRLCGVSLPSACNVTNFARGLLSRRTTKKAPSRFKAGEIDKLKGAEVGLNCVTGLHEGVAVIDYKGLYPSLILGNNLSYETKRDGPGENIIQLENGSYWDQTEQGLLPSVVEYLFEYRSICKDRMRNAKSPEERAAWNTTQMAVKRVMASLYGMTAHIGYGWADADIAHTITQEGRRCIKLLDSVATTYGFECLYGHTDSAFVKVPSVDEAHALAERITVAVQGDTGNAMLFAELEAWMPYWLLTKKNRYVGKVAWPEEDSGKLKVAGFGMKASNTSPISKKIQKGVFELICNGATEGEVEEFVHPIAMSVRKGDIDLNDVSMKTRLGMHLKDYKVLGGASKAATHYNETHSDKFGKGDSVPWTYIEEAPGIMAYRTPRDLEGYTLNSEMILKKMLYTKLDSVYSTLSWDLSRALGAPSPKAYGWW